MRLFVGAIANATGLTHSQLMLENRFTILNTDELISNYTDNVAAKESLNEDGSQISEAGGQTKVGLLSTIVNLPEWCNEQFDLGQFPEIMAIGSAELSAYVGALCIPVMRVPTSRSIGIFITRARSRYAFNNPKIFIENSQYLNLVY